MTRMRPQATVARGLVPRAYPLRRPDAVRAPGRVDARVKPAHDEVKVAELVLIYYRSAMTAWVYIMSNRRNGTLYIGVTASLAARVWQHKTGSEPSFTRRYGLSQLVYAERHEEMIRAIQREKTMKHWPRAWKIAAIEGLNPEWKDLFGSLSLEG